MNCRLTFEVGARLTLIRDSIVRTIIVILAGAMLLGTSACYQTKTISDQPASTVMPQYTPEEVGQLVKMALTKEASLTYAIELVWSSDIEAEYAGRGMWSVVLNLPHNPTQLGTCKYIFAESTGELGAVNRDAAVLMASVRSAR